MYNVRCTVCCCIYLKPCCLLQHIAARLLVIWQLNTYSTWFYVIIVQYRIVYFGEFFILNCVVPHHIVFVHWSQLPVLYMYMFHVKFSLFLLTCFILYLLQEAFSKFCHLFTVTLCSQRPVFTCDFCYVLWRDLPISFFLVKFLIVNSAVELEFLWLTLDMIWQHCLCADNCRIFYLRLLTASKIFTKLHRKTVRGEWLIAISKLTGSFLLIYCSWYSTNLC